MAVEILFLSVVLRKSALERLDCSTREVVHNLFCWQPCWFREDEHLWATSFMAPRDVRGFGSVLEARGSLLRIQDWNVVDMATGPTDPCHWLEYRGGIGKLTGVWLNGTVPGDLARPMSLVPDERSNVPKGKVMKLFGRDSNHDDEGHRDDFGKFLPHWGGKDLWLVEVPPEVSGSQNPTQRRYMSIECPPDLLAI